MSRTDHKPRALAARYARRIWTSTDIDDTPAALQAACLAGYRTGSRHWYVNHRTIDELRAELTMLKQKLEALEEYTSVDANSALEWLGL